MTESQYRYMKKAAEICRHAGDCAWGVTFCIWVPGNANSGRACLRNGWLGAEPYSTYYVTAAGRAALAEHEAKMEAKR